MKKILYISLVVVLFIGCKEKIQEVAIDYLIFGKDTIVIKGANVIDYSKLHGYSIRGHKDTLTGIWYDYISFNVGVDSLTYDGKSMKAWKSGEIKVDNQNGDLIMDNAVKNVYNK